MIFTSRNRKLSAKIKRLEELEKNVTRLNEENHELLKVVKEREKALNQIITEKSIGFPWLVNAIGEFYKYQDFEIARYLETKKHPAQRKADLVRDLANDKKLLRKQLKTAQNFVALYESIFPFIKEYVGEDLDELLKSIALVDMKDEQFDPVLNYVPRQEYENLTHTERNQKALDNYLRIRRRPHEIGRDYERYIGYLYEKEGFTVEYFGIEKGYEDLGRDLICKKGDVVDIVQCKCWSSKKTIHEKHINQLYGTAIKYYVDHFEMIRERDVLSLFSGILESGQIKATFVTSTILSEEARKFAKALGVKVIENSPLKEYPLIKCNISVNGDRIYHLPFDQQYDNTLIKNKGEFYASTVVEAEAKGFRRAFRWHGNDMT